MFKITDGKGFHITFANGVTVSVQFGYGNYCDNRYIDVDTDPYNSKTSAILGAKGSSNAEVAVFKGEEFIIPPARFGSDGDEVIGYVTPELLAEIMIWAKCI